MLLEESRSSSTLSWVREDLDDCLAIIRENPELAGRIVPGLPFAWGEIPLAVTHEMALRLDDVIRRRIPLGYR